jgi:hypothetical protein
MKKYFYVFCTLIFWGFTPVFSADYEEDWWKDPSIYMEEEGVVEEPVPEIAATEKISIFFSRLRDESQHVFEYRPGNARRLLLLHELACSTGFCYPANKLVFESESSFRVFTANLAGSGQRGR